VSSTTAELITQLLAAWNAHDADRTTAFYAPDYEGVDVGEALPQRGQQGAGQALARYLRAFPDLSFSQEAVLVDHEQAVLFWIARGTHQGKLMNIPPTGRMVEVRGMSLFTLQAGKIKQAMVIWDVAGLLRAIGLLPELYNS
jgi:steroid delta-isomerase-like uncharacterized protein